MCWRLSEENKGHQIHPCYSQGRDRGHRKDQKTAQSVHSPWPKTGRWPGEAAENHSVYIQTQHLGIWGHKTSDLAWANSALGRRGWKKLKRGRGQNIKRWWRTSCVSPDGQPGICQSVPKQSVWNPGNNCRRKVISKNEAENIQVALAEEEEQSGQQNATMTQAEGWSVLVGSPGRGCLL